MSKKNSLEAKRARQAVAKQPHTYPPYYVVVPNGEYTKLIKTGKVEKPKYITMNTIYLGMVAQILGLKV